MKKTICGLTLEQWQQILCDYEIELKNNFFGCPFLCSIPLFKYNFKNNRLDIETLADIFLKETGNKDFRIGYMFLFTDKYINDCFSITTIHKNLKRIHYQIRVNFLQYIINQFNTQ